MQAISLLKEIYNSEDANSLFHLLASFPNNDSSHNRIQQYLNFKKEKQGVVCPHCESKSINKFGNSKNKTQKYKCKKCNKIFCEYTNTFLYRIHHKKQLVDFYTLSIAGASLNSCSTILNIAKQTAFNWRHKSNSSLVEMNSKTIDGIVELITFEMPISRKGERELPPNPRALTLENVKKSIYKRVPKIIAPEGIKEVAQISMCANREDQYLFSVLNLGDLTINELTENFKNRLKKIRNLCIPVDSILKSYAISRRISYQQPKESSKLREREKCYHTNTVEDLYVGFLEWLKRFRGVATKYLQNYLNWYLVEVQYKRFKLFPDLYTIFALYNSKGKEDYQSCRLFIE